MRPVSLTMTLAQNPKKIPIHRSQQAIFHDNNKILTSHDPKLPEHDESAANTMRSHLSRIYGDCGVLCPYSNTLSGK